MTFIKATYTKKIAAAKASVRYIEHRPGQDGARITRALFGKDGTMTRQQAYQHIDDAAKAKRSNFYRIVISPDPKAEDAKRDLQLREITKQTMQTLEERLNISLHWVAAEHNDHAPNRHIHVVAVVPGKLLQTPDFQALRETATQACLEQRQERDHSQEQGRGEELELELQQDVSL